MAKLPNAEHAMVPPLKITGYLLNDSHPTGGPKSAFLQRFGFLLARPDALEAALLAHALAHDVRMSITTSRGMKYEISGPMVCPDGRMPIVKTVWIVLNGETAPRFVTAVPD